MPCSMSENGAFTAIERIERALARIEFVASRPQPTAGADIALAEMTARHRSLRDETQRALTDLDALISSVQ